MKASTVIALAAGITAVSAQLNAIPSCALGCAISSLGSTGCAQTDIKCICSNQAFVASLLPCVEGACPADQLGSTETAAINLCSSAGVSLVIPTATGSAMSSSTSMSAASTTTAVVTTTSTSTASTMTTSTTSVVVVVPPATNTTTTASSAPTTNATVTTGAPPPPSTPTGAAARNTVAIGALGAVLAFAAAFL